MKKRILAIVMAMLFLVSSSTIAFAASTPEVVAHTVAISVPPTLTSNSAGREGGGSRMWNSVSYYIESYVSVLYSPYFTIPDPYFAYETYATGAPSGYYTVKLYKSNGQLIGTTSNLADGSSRKNDWLSVSAGSQYRFKVLNNTGSNITVYLTYYSWT